MFLSVWDSTRVCLCCLLRNTARNDQGIASLSNRLVCQILQLIVTCNSQGTELYNGIIAIQEDPPIVSSGARSASESRFTMARQDCVSQWRALELRRSATREIRDCFARDKFSNRVAG